MYVTTGRNPGLRSLLSISVGKRWFCLWRGAKPLASVTPP